MLCILHGMSNFYEHPATIPLPQYEARTKVYALRVYGVATKEDGSGLLSVDPPYHPVEVTKEFMEAFNPEAPGYYVVYENGGKNFMLEAMFNADFTLVNTPLNMGDRILRVPVPTI